MLSREIQNKIAPYEFALRTAAICVGMLVTLGLWISTMLKARGDFLLHYEFGRRLRMGEFLYTNGMHLPYPPSWAMAFAPFSFFPPRVAMPLVFACGFVALVALLKILRDLTAAYFSLKDGQVFWITPIVLLVLSRFVLRDFADGGENLIIVALTWGGIYFFVKQKPIPGGALLGLAIALKCTPLLFAGYFVLKRQWLAVASTLVFSTLFFLSPMLIQGRNSYLTHIKFWKGNVLAGVSQKDPSVGVLGPDELANKSLRPMLARYLMQLPTGHPGRFPGAAHIDFLRLSPAAANWIVKLATFGSFLLIMGMFTLGRSDVRSVAFLWECATINILMLLYSPITWGEHCVALIPASYLIALRFIGGKPVPRWINYTIIAVAAILILVNRSIIGETLSSLAESYHVITLCMIAMVVVALAFWREEKNSTSIPSQS